MIKTVSILHEELKNYSNIKSKIQSLCSRGDLYPLVRKTPLADWTRISCSNSPDITAAPITEF